MSFQNDKFNITYQDTQGGYATAMYTPTKGSSGDDFLPSTKSGSATNDITVDNYFPAEVVPNQGLRVTAIAQSSGTATTGFVVAEGLVVRKGEHGGTGETTSWTYLVDPQVLDVT